MNIILGADGYIGAELSYQIEAHVVDNYYKRNLLQSLEIKPLYKTPFLYTRGFERAENPDIASYCKAEYLINRYKPDIVIDLSEQPSAPYSMINPDTGIDTIRNNLMGTLNLIYAIRDYSPHTHLIKLGTMGQFGTPNFQIEEGFMDIEHKGRKDTIPVPTNPYSIYHLSKAYDSEALRFACNVWGLKVTDLQQGFVHSLVNYDEPTRFCYDGIFGTALNRFMIQAIAGHPLTVYGEGGQTRGILHLQDTIQCIKLAMENPPEEGEYRVANQLTEWKSINELAGLVSEAAQRHGIRTHVEHYRNPRKEKESHYYKVTHKVMEDYGLKPHLLTVDMIAETMEFLKQYKENIEVDQILNSPRWS